MDKRRTFCLSMGVAAGVMALAVIGTNLSSNVASGMRLNASGVTYTLTVNDQALFAEGKLEAEVDGGNYFVTLVSTGNGLSLGSGKSLSNEDPIHGLQEVEITLTSGAVTVYGDYEEGAPRNRVMGSLSESGTVYFGEGMSYFRVVANADAAISKIKLTYDCETANPYAVYDGIVLDGEFDDPQYTDAIRTNAYLLKKDAKNYIKIYGAKKDAGLHLFLDYTVEAPKTVGGGWWEWDNCEFCLADDAKIWSGQYWLSAEDGGSFCCVGSGEKREPIFYKPVAVGADGLYHGAFELFAPYGDDRLVKDQTTYACFGFNPKAGWHAGHKWKAETIDDSVLQITADGFAHDGTSCYAGHVYGEWIVDVANNCRQDGHAYRDCSICGHRDEKVIPMDPTAHVFDYEHATISVAPTCTSTGIGVATCTVCGETKETILPYDYTNHTDSAYGTSHNYCHDCGIGSHLTNSTGDTYNHAFGGWDNKSTWYDIGVWSGDFTVTFEFNMRGCIDGNPSDPAGTCWRTALPILYKEGWQSDAGTGNRVDHVFRMDWWGWDDGAFTTASNNGSCPAGFDWGINYYGYSNMDIVLVIAKSGANVTLDWTWTVKAEGAMKGKVFDYHQSCTLVDGSKVGVALTAEWTNCTITKANLAR